MPAITNGLVEITLQYTQSSEVAMNVFHYYRQGGGPTDDMAELLVKFDTLIFPAFSNLCGVSTTFDLLSARDVFGIFPDQELIPSVLTGNRTTEPMNSFSAWRCNLNVSTKETRRGYKRFGGLVEGVANGNSLTTLFRDECKAFGVVLEGGLATSSAIYGHVIYGRPTPTNPTRHVQNPITSTTVPNRIVPQTSRKQ